MYVCIFIKLHITAQSGPVTTYSMVLNVTHLGVIYRKHILGKKYVCMYLSSSHIVGTFNMPTSYQYWVWAREAILNRVRLAP